MSAIETIVNVTAIFCFTYFLYRLSLIAISLPFRLKALNEQLTAITALNERINRQLRKVRKKLATCQTLDNCFRQSTNRNPSAKSTLELIWKAARCRSANDHTGADRLIEKCIGDLALNYHHHFYLASLATDMGMLFTVIGGMLAFQHIGTSDSPFAAFPSLALAMLTTAAGLVISICVKQSIQRFQNRLQKVANDAMSASVLLGQSLSTLGIQPSKSAVPAQEEETQSTAVAEASPDSIEDSQSEQPEKESPTEPNQNQQDFSNALLPPDTDNRDYIFSH